MNMFSGYESQAAAYADSSERMAFIRRTYGLLGLAVAAFVGLEVLLFTSGIADKIFGSMSVRGSGIIIMILFMVGSGIAHAMANNRSNVNVQYMGLGLLIVLWTVMMCPILFIAENFFPGKNLAMQAGILTLLVFGGLTLSVFISGKDFSFMGSALTALSFAALGIIVISFFMGGGLGIWFSFAMVALCCGYIIYDTSNIMLHYGTGEHVAASLALFASVALMFYYILRIFMISRND